VKEPLLDVGPAGVSGNNQTRDIPSPSKKRGYAKRSPLKQVGVNVLESKSTGDQIVKGNEIQEDVYDTGNSLKGLTQKQLDWRDNEIEKLGGIDQYHAKYGSKAKGKKTGGQVGTGKFEDDKVIPGTTTETNEFTPTQTRDNNDAMSPWRVRQQSRSIKKSGKDVRQSQNKLDKVKRKQQKMIDKYDTADPITGKKDGKISDEEKSAMSTGFLGFGNKQKKFDKLASSFTENTNELDAFNKNMTARTRQVEMSSDPLGKNRTFKSASRNMELPDASSTYSGQKEIIDSGGVKKPASIDFGELGKTEDTDTEKLSGALPKKTPDFFKKKTPLKMKYFK
jgi:hypothetical protein